MSDQTNNPIPKQLSGRLLVELGQTMAALRQAQLRPLVELGQTMAALRQAQLRPLVELGQTMAALRQAQPRPLVELGQTMAALRQAQPRLLVELGQTMAALRQSQLQPLVELGQTMTALRQSQLQPLVELGQTMTALRQAQLQPLVELRRSLGTTATPSAVEQTEEISKSALLSGKALLQPESQGAVAIPGYVDLFDVLITDPGLISFCKKLFVDGHYSMAVFRAFTYVANTVKQKSGIADKDGSSLMKTVLSLNSPVLRLNPMQSQSERDQQLGYMEMFAGSMTGVRNPRAHEHDLVDSPAEAFEMLVMANHWMRVLNNATHTGGIS